MLRIAICEDNFDENEKLLTSLAQYQKAHPEINFQIRSFSSGNGLLKNISSGHRYDMFLLDVILPGITGIELAQKLREDDPDVPIIFLTGSADYALPAFRVSAVQYLLKPFAEKELFNVFDKVLALQRLGKEKYFIFSAKERDLKIAFSAIVYVEISGHVMIVYLENGETNVSKSIKVPFRTAIAPLLEDGRFLYAHKSFLTNMEHVQELRGKDFVMTGEVVIPISKRNIAKAKECYLRYLSSRGAGYSEHAQNLFKVSA